MNLPVSDIVMLGKKTMELDYKKEIGVLMDKQFTGYFVVTVDGFDGIEEGVLVLRNGLAYACIYEILNYGATVFGDAAAKHVFNAFVNPKGIIDVCGLSNQQVDLIGAFNDKLKFQKPLAKKDLSRLFASKHNSEFSKEILSEIVSAQEKEAPKESVLKRFGLGSLG